MGSTWSFAITLSQTVEAAALMPLPEVGKSGETSPAGAHKEKFSHYFLYQLIKLNSLSHVVSCNSAELNELTDKSNQKEGRDIEAKDFAGTTSRLGFTAYILQERPIRNTAFTRLEWCSIAI